MPPMLLKSGNCFRFFPSNAKFRKPEIPVGANSLALSAF